MKKPFRNNNNLFTETTFRKWFISSIFIISIFIAFGILLYLGCLYVTKQVLIVAQEQSAEQTKDLIDVKLYNFKKDISVFTFNDRIISTAYTKQPFSGSDIYNYHKVGKELIGIYSYKNIQDIYLYYSNGDCFVGCYNMVYDDNETFTQERFGMSAKEWRKIAKKQLTSVFVKKQDSIYFLCPLIRHSGREVTCLVIVELDAEDLKEVLFKGNDSTQEESYSYIVSGNGDLIATTGDSTRLIYDYGTLKQGKNYIDKNVVTCKRLENADWEYICIVPLNQYLKEIYDLHLLLYIYIGICIVLACGIVNIETRSRYRPVQALHRNLLLSNEMDTLKQDISHSKQDIFVNLQNTIINIVHDNTNLKSKLKKEKETLISIHFSEIMERHLIAEEDIDFFKNNFNMPLKQGIVSIVDELSRGSKLDDISVEERENILLLCLNNIGSELLGDRYKCYFWKYVKITGVIWSDQEEEVCSNLYMINILEQIRICIKQYFDVEFRFTLSKLCQSSSGLASAYNEAKAAYDYCNVSGKLGVIRYDESYTKLLPLWKDMDVLQAEQDFMSYMREHSYTKAKTKLEMIIGYYGYTDGASNQLLKCRMFGLINLMLNAIEMEKTQEEEQFYLNLNPIQRLLKASTIQNVVNEIMSIIEALIVHYDESEDTIERKLDHISRYIEAHYMDYELSVQQLADIFQLSLSHLSKVYKQQKGIGVLEVINLCKIRHVKELLIQEPNMSLAQIAERVGYGNVQTMMRIFKKIEKQTPGVYRVKFMKK